MSVAAERTVLFVLMPGLHLLDLAGPAQVFSTANDHGGRYRLTYVAADGSVTTHQGLPLVAATVWPTTPVDTVVVPGWRMAGGPPDCPVAEHLLDRVVTHHAGGGRVASVCAGAFALAAAGLLDGRRVTTHHDLQTLLAQRFPRADVVRDVLYVADGSLYSSAGIASGIDLALHLVSLDHGPVVAARTASALVVAARREGAARQHHAGLRHRDHHDVAVHRVQDLIEAGFDGPLPLADLARRVGVSPRTLTRVFAAATGLSPLEYQQGLRVEQAQRLVALGWTREQAAREVGFTDARMLRRLTARGRPERDIPASPHPNG